MFTYTECLRLGLFRVIKFYDYPYRISIRFVIYVRVLLFGHALKNSKITYTVPEKKKEKNSYKNNRQLDGARSDVFMNII